MMRGFVTAMQIPIFDRVNQIAFKYRDLRQIPLVKEDVARLRELKQSAVTKNGGEAITESDIGAIEDLVPPCRFASLNKTASQIKIQIRPGFGCCSK